MIKEIIINPKILPFDIKTRESCSWCKRYGTKATCPPYIDSFQHYKNILKQYKYGKLYYEIFEIKDKNDWEKIGKDTSLEIHDKLLDVRNNLFKKGHYFINVFGAGSCKLCKECSFPCRYPQKALIPLEAVGVDVVQLMKRYKINIKFPVINEVYRIGMVLYD